MDGQKTAHWQTQDFLCVNVCHLTPFVTISGVKESRLPVSQVVYSMMEWSSADQKIVSRCVCQLFILFFFFFLAGLAFWSFFLCMLRLRFAFSSMPLKQNKGWMGVFPHKRTIDMFLFCNYVFIFSFLRCWLTFDTQVHWHWENSRPETEAHWQFFVLFSCMKSQQIAVLKN